jgi:SAM-dependent methyltransferase
LNSPHDYPGKELDVFAEAQNWKRYFADLLRPFVIGRVLEVGAGIGATTKALFHSGVTSWTCLEPDPNLAGRLRETVDALSPKPSVIVGTIDEASGVGPFDTILYIDVLEHIEDDAEEMRRAAARLDRGGKLIVLAPAFQWLYSEFDRSIGHHRRYTRKSLRSVFPNRLREKEIFYADALGASLSFANRTVIRTSSPRLGDIKLWDRYIIPMSRIIDPVIARSFGRSVIAVYEAPG